MPCSTPDAYQLIHEGAQVLAQIEANGCRIDVQYLDDTIATVEAEIKAKEQRAKGSKVWADWKKMHGTNANFDSRQQLAELFFGPMGFTTDRKTAGGDRDAADEEALERTGHKFAAKYIALQKQKKLLNTYLRAVRAEVVDSTQLLHCFFNLHRTLTYRSSSDSINFQNIPIREGAVAALIRKAFVAHDDDYHIVEIDFSGAEVKVAACYNEDPVLLNYILDPTTDMHRDMAGEIFCLEEDQITKTARQVAKGGFVFAEFYGDWYVKCAQSLWYDVERYDLKTADGVGLYDHLAQHGIAELGECTGADSHRAGTFERHLRAVENAFWKKRFKVYDKWRRDWYDNYLRTGGFMTKTGFYIEGMFSKNHVINNPIQGSSFHCLLWALIRLQRHVVKHKMRTKIFGQIHDSVVASVHKDELDDFIGLARDMMSRRLTKAWPWLIVPMDVEVDVAPLGGSWNDKKELTL